MEFSVTWSLLRQIPGACVKPNGNHLRHLSLFICFCTNLCIPFTKANNLLSLWGTTQKCGCGKGKTCSSQKKLHKLDLNLKKGEYRQLWKPSRNSSATLKTRANTVCFVGEELLHFTFRYGSPWEPSLGTGNECCANSRLSWWAGFLKIVL